MADTALNSAAVQSFWSKKVLLQKQQDSFVEMFIGNTERDIIYEVTDFKGPGTTINIPLLKSLSGAGVADDAALEGSEEAMVHSTTAITLHERAHAVRMTGKLEEQKTAMDMRSQAKRQLGDWAARKQDNNFFVAMNPDGAVGLRTTSLLTDAANWADDATYEAWNVVCAGDATDWLDLDSPDTLNCRLISKAKRVAMIKGVRPCRIPMEKGYKAVYALVISPEMEFDLTQDDNYVSMNSLAQLRGIDNPLVNGAIGMIDGVLIHTYSNEVDGGAGATLLEYMNYTTHWATCGILMGAQACGVAYAQQPNWYERMFEYGRKYGVATSMILGFAKTVMNRGTIAAVDNQDYGAVYVLTAATKLA